MISTQDCYSLPEANFEGDEESHGLHAVVAPVHVVPHEEIVGVQAPSAHPEELQQIIELTVHVTTYCHRGAGGDTEIDVRMEIIKRSLSITRDHF